MRKHRVRLSILLSILFAICCVIAPVYLSAQQVFPTQQVNPTQVNDPGNPLTLQSYVSGTNTAGAGTCNITIPAQTGKTLYITGIEITGGGATAASIVVVTLASGGTTIANWDIVVPAGATTSITPLILSFPKPIVGLAPGQNMALTVPSFGAGNTNVASHMQGYAQ